LDFFDFSVLNYKSGEVKSVWEIDSSPA